MKNSLFILLCFLSFAFAKAQTVQSDLLIQSSQGSTSSLADITGTLQDGMIFYDTVTDKAYVYTNGQWRKVYYAPIINAQTSNYTLTAADDGNVITFNSATNVTLTVPAGLEVGFNVSLYQLGIGRVTIIGAGSVNVLNRLSRFNTAGPNAGAGLICTAIDTFHVTGDLKR